MTPQILTLLLDCIAKDNLLPFYKLRAWALTRKAVLQLDHHECQRCRRQGRHTRATIVHHINHAKDRPDLALSIWHEDNGKRKRNLESLCHGCHEIEHEHRQKESAPPLTPERW